MEPSSPYRPRVSRETRLLLTAGIAALAVLWLLARIRFQDRPITPNPVPAVLSQLGNGPHFDELASDLAQLQSTLDPLLVMIRPAAGALDSPGVLAIKWRDDLAIGLAAKHVPEADNVSARDPASGIAVFKVQADSAVTPLTPWAARRPQQPRFFAVAEAGFERPVLRPVFVGGLVAVDTPLWSQPVWRVPGRVDLGAGSFVFTSSAELVGLVVNSDGGPLIVPAQTLFEEASRLLDRSPAERGTIGLAAQELTPALSAVTGASNGVIVTWVDRAGPGADVRIGDVVEAVDGQPLISRKQWEVWSARLRADATVTLRIRRRADVLEKTITAAAVAHEAPRERPLGLALRPRRGLGVEVVSVEPRSAAEAAGLAPGDVITWTANIDAPTPVQVTRAFAALQPGGHLMVALTRDDTHRIATVER